MDPGVYEQRIEVRMRRQRVLEGDSRPRYRVLLDEAVLYRRVGGSAVMADQINKSWKLRVLTKRLFRSCLSI